MATVFDGLGRLFGGASRRSVSATEVVGHIGTSAYGGYIEEHEKNAKLRNRKKYETYSEIMANTSIVSAGVRYYLNVLGRAEWRCEPAEDTGSEAQAELYAELIQDMMSDMETPWTRVVRRSAMYRMYGFSIQEKTAKLRDDGYIGLRDIAPRPQKTITQWDLDDNGRVAGMVQEHPETLAPVYLPRQKVVYLVDDSLNDSPEGLGLFRNVVEPASRLSVYQMLEGFGFETDLRGIPIVRIPYAAIDAEVKANRLTQADANKAIAEFEEFVNKHIKTPQLGLTMESQPYESTGENRSLTNTRMWDVELLKGDGANFEAVANSIERLNHEIARTLGVEHLLLGQTRGTQALSQDKSDNFGMIVDSSLDEIRETYDRDIVDWIFELNGWDPAFKPTLKTSKIQYRDINKVTEALQNMSNAGAVLMPDDPVINDIRDELGVSRQVLTDMAVAAALPNQPSDTDPEGGTEDDE